MKRSLIRNSIFLKSFKLPLFKKVYDFIQKYELIPSHFSFSQILIDAKEERWKEMHMQIMF